MPPLILILPWFPRVIYKLQRNIRCRKLFYGMSNIFALFNAEISLFF